MPSRPSPSPCLAAATLTQLTLRSPWQRATPTTRWWCSTLSCRVSRVLRRTWHRHEQRRQSVTPTAGRSGRVPPTSTEWCTVYTLGDSTCNGWTLCGQWESMWHACMTFSRTLLYELLLRPQIDCTVNPSACSTLGGARWLGRRIPHPVSYGIHLGFLGRNIPARPCKHFKHASPSNCIYQPRGAAVDIYYDREMPKVIWRNRLHLSMKFCHRATMKSILM